MKTVGRVVFHSMHVYYLVIPKEMKEGVFAIDTLVLTFDSRKFAAESLEKQAQNL